MWYAHTPFVVDRFKSGFSPMNKSDIIEVWREAFAASLCSFVFKWISLSSLASTKIVALDLSQPSSIDSNLVSLRWKNLIWLKFEEKHLLPLCASLSSNDFQYHCLHQQQPKKLHYICRNERWNRHKWLSKNYRWKLTFVSTFHKVIFVPKYLWFKFTKLSYVPLWMLNESNELSNSKIYYIIQ